MRTDEIRGAGRLLGFIAGGGTQRVHETHSGIAERVFRHIPASRPVRQVHDGIAGPAYRAVEVAARYAPRVVGSLIAETRTDQGVALDSSRGGRLATSALNGIYGDWLAREIPELACTMSIRHSGGILEADGGSPIQIAGASRKIVVFLHGLCENDDSWFKDSTKHHGTEGVSYGSLLQRDHGYTSLYVRFNSGLHTSDNGRALSAALENLTGAWPVPVEEIALVGHSMGGLVARSACHYGNAADSTWSQYVRQVITLGTPHLGAPLEKGVHVSKLAFDRLPETQALAKFLDLRSAGVRDLRYGACVDEDWRDVDPNEYLQDRCQETPFLEHATYYFVAATIAASPESRTGRVLGDLMVQLPSASGKPSSSASASASGKSRQRSVPFEIDNGRSLGGLNHFDLLNHPRVYEHLAGWLSSPEPTASDHLMI